MTFPKTCFNPTCNCKDLKLVREVTLRCSNCHCGVKVEETKLGNKKREVYESWDADELLFTVVKNGKDST